MENKSRRILLWIACFLGVLLVLSRLAGSPVGESWAETDARIAQLKQVLRTAGEPADTEAHQARLTKAEPYFSSPIPARQQYLETLIGPGFISSIDSGQPIPAPDWPGKRIVSFQLKLRLTLEDLWDVLGRLDADGQPMRIEHLRIRPVDETDRTLQADLTVLTLADEAPVSVSPGATETATSKPVVTTPMPVPAPAKVPTSRPARKNIFFPVGLIARPTPTRSDTAISPFRLVGVDSASLPPRALLLLYDTEEIVWLQPGMTVAGAKLTDVDADGAVFVVDRESDRIVVGQTSGRLMLGKRTFKTRCTICGVIQDGEQSLALAQFAGRSDFVYLAIGDTLQHGGKIVSIGGDSITLDYGGYDEIIRVGQDTDNPYMPGMVPE